MKEVHGLEIPQISPIWVLCREHTTQNCLPSIKSNEKSFYRQNIAAQFHVEKHAPCPWNQRVSPDFCFVHSTEIVCLLFNIRKKRGGTENRAENPPLHCLKRREEEGPSNALLGNTESLLPLHKNEAERDLDNNRNSHFRSQFVQPWSFALKRTKNHFLQCSSAGALFQ